MNIVANPVVEVDQTVYLKDYQKPSFLVDSVDLDIQVFDDKTYVTAKLVMQRQTAGDLVLLGRDLELKSIALNGQALAEDAYTLDTEQLVIANAPDQVVIETQVLIHPETNTSWKVYIKPVVICLLRKMSLKVSVKLLFTQTVQMYFQFLPHELKQTRNSLYFWLMVI